MRLLLLHGPNLNLLGVREPDVYGTRTLASINDEAASLASELGASLEARQSNHEGHLIDWIHQAAYADEPSARAEGIILNPGAFTHTSIAIRDAIAGSGLPCIEVHLSNVHAREAFRQHSYIAPVAIGTIAGFGPGSYLLGVRAMVEYVRAHKTASGV